MEEIIEIINFEIQNSGYADKLAAGIVITGGGAMLKHLPQLMNFRTAMDVRIGYPNEHLAGKGKDELNQPMYATAVGLILRGIDHLETYKKSFEAGSKEDFVKTRKPGTEKVASKQVEEPEAAEAPEPVSHDRVPITERIKQMIANMFEVEDQTIN
jgi:cell division protein FtsA